MSSQDPLGVAALNVAISDLYIRETEPNWGPEVAEFLRAVGVNGPAAWCAAAVHNWIGRASQKIGIPSPVEPVAGAQETARRFQVAGRWLDKRIITIQNVRPGMIPIWNRGTPEEPWRGHIGIVEKTDNIDTIFTVEGNMPVPEEPEQQGVARIKRPFSEPRLMGFGVLSGPLLAKDENISWSAYGLGTVAFVATLFGLMKYIRR